MTIAIEHIERADARRMSSGNRQELGRSQKKITAILTLNMLCIYFTFK